MIYLEGDFEGIVQSLHHKLMDAPPVDTGHWQGLKNVPHTATRELRNVVFETMMPDDMFKAQFWCQPNLPWAEAHFQERVSGLPLNPGEEYMNWPWYRGGVEDHKKGGAFSHSYMERLWPTHASPEGMDKDSQPSVSMGFRQGIRYRYGDLDDLVNLLWREPHTRQAWLPIWFPEDTGAVQEGMRVPCSIGYLFQMREGRLHVNYVMRSTDFLRYLRDDTYLTVRLAQWILEQLQDKEHDILGPEYVGEHGGEMWLPGDTSDGVTLGKLSFTTYSLHVFEGDMPKMRREAPPTP